MLDLYQKYQPHPKNISQLKVAIQSIWSNDLPQDLIDRSILSFTKRSRAHNKAGGGHFEHLTFVAASCCTCTDWHHHCIALCCKCLKCLITFCWCFWQLAYKITHCISLVIICVSVIQFSIYSVHFIVIFETIAEIKQNLQNFCTAILDIICRQIRSACSRMTEMDDWSQ